MHFVGFIAKTCNNETHEECQQFARQMRMRWPFQKKRREKKKHHIPNAWIYKHENTDLARPYSQSFMGLTHSLYLSL